MNDKNDRLSKEELQYLIARLGLPEDELADNAGTFQERSSADQAALQADLKLRLRRGIDEMRDRKEEIPEPLLKLIERL